MSAPCDEAWENTWRRQRQAGEILAYGPNQERDEKGRFGSGGAGSKEEKQKEAEPPKDPGARPARPEGGFRDDAHIAQHAADMVKAHEADPHIQALTARRDELRRDAERVRQDAYREGTLEAIKAGQQKYAEAKEREKKADEALQHEARRSCLLAFRVPHEQQAAIRGDPLTKGLGRGRLDNWQKAADFIKESSHRDAIGNRAAVGLGVAKNGRAHYELAGIYTAKGDGPEIHAHEYGHHLEEKDDVRGRVQDFARERFGSEPYKDMRDVDPRGGYKKGEESGRKDDMAKAFTVPNPEAHAYYSGKSYSGGRSEVLSMGLEQLYRDPVHLAKADPQYFSLIVGALQRPGK